MSQLLSESGDRICAIIPAYNSARFLAEAIESAIAQTVPFTEIIVVDDGSTDDPKSICDRYPQVLYLYQNNQGVSAARNTGFRSSNCELVVFLDSDDCLLPTAVEIGLNCLNTNPDAGFVFGDYLFESINPDGSYTVQPRNYQPPAVASYATILAVTHQMQCAGLLFRRSAIESVGGFDPSLTMMEDLNLFMRIARELPIYYHQQTVCRYRYNGNNVSSQPAKMLVGALQSHRRQGEYVNDSGNPEYLAAYAQGRQAWIEFFGERFPYAIMRCASAGKWLEGLGYLRLLLNYDPQLAALNREIYDSAYQALMAQLQELPLSASLAYWREHLAGAPILALPSDRPRSQRSSFYEQSSVVAIDPALETLAQQEGVTLTTLLVAAVNVLLYRYTGTTDICVGIPSVQQSDAQTWVNPLVLRTDVADLPSFRSLLQRVQQVITVAEQHQAVPFELLVKEQPESTTHPLFQVAVVETNVVNIDQLEFSNLTASDWLVTERAAKFDLMLTTDGVGVSWVYNPDLFDATTIEQRMAEFETLLTGIVATPDRAIGKLPLLTATTIQQLGAWNQTQTDYPDLCVHQLFERQVELTPDEIAVVFNEDRMTYRQLNNRSNQLARHLQIMGVRPDVLVGIWLERSIEMVVGLLGILKAGAAYLPLDPAYPQERLTYMLDNSKVAVLLTSQQLLPKLPEYAAQIIQIDSDWQRKISHYSSTNLATEVGLDNLGYTIYTSGSTGTPKGVAMPQRSLCNLIWWQIHHTTVTEHAKTLQFTPISFDVSFQEIFSTWCMGGTLVLIGDELRRDPSALLQVLEVQQIDRLFLPFVALQQLAEVAANNRLFPQHLREVITAGEQLQITPAIRKFFSNLNNCSLHNHYGPSESHVVTTFSLTAPVSEWTTLPPIGRPIANTQIYLLDSQMQPMPIGVAGELYIRGDCLAQGYLNRPDLTAERFVPPPPDFSLGLTGAAPRLYRTGDLARYLPDGKIEYLGRIDNQVKIRGFRIELGEIESLLGQHPAIAQCCTIVREDIPRDKRLVAYYVAHDEPPPPAELREFMKCKVPSYMVPVAFVLLRDLPITVNGKVDRQALLASQLEYFEPLLPALPIAIAHQSNSTNLATEAMLVQIWTEVLGRRVGVNDNFFDLGGNSISILKVLVQIQAQLGDVEISAVKLFQYSTIARLAEYLNGVQPVMVTTRDKLQSRAQLQKAANARRRR